MKDSCESVKHYNKTHKEYGVRFDLNDTYFKFTGPDNNTEYGKISDLLHNFTHIINTLPEWPYDHIDLSDPFYQGECLGLSLENCPVSTAYDAEVRRRLDDEYGFNHSNKSDFWSNNMSILTKVFEIASDGAPLEQTLLHWANSAASVEGTIRVMVQCAKGEVIIKGAPYGIGLPGIILRGARLNGLDAELYPSHKGPVKNHFTKSDQAHWPEATKFVYDKLDDILDYLHSKGVDCEYNERRHYIICKQSTFPSA